MAICTSSLEKWMSNRSSFHFLIRLFVCLLLICLSSLYTLDMNPLLYMWFVHIFSHLGCLFILLIVFFALQKIFSLTYSHLIIFYFCFPCLRRCIQKDIGKTHVKEHIPKFSSRGLMVLDLTFKSSINFELIFVHGVR